MEYQRSHTYVAIPPGATIKEMLDDRGMTQKEFAARMDMSEKHISKLINGEVHLTHDAAIRLEMVLGMPAHFWTGLEDLYRQTQIRVKEERALDEDQQLASRMPYAEMASYGWVPATRNRKEKALNLRRYFEVVNLSLITNTRINRIICHRLETSDKADLALLAWAQQARIQARDVETSRLNIRTLEEMLPQISALQDLQPDEYRPALQQILAECGIALIYLPRLKGSYLQAATFRDGNKIVIAMASGMRGARTFWYNLYHELGHICLGHLEREKGTDENDERAADAWAHAKLDRP